MEGLQPPSNRSTSLNSTSGVVENMSEQIQGEAPPPSVPRSRGKLIAIVVAVILVLVAVSAVAVYYLIPAGFSGTIKVGFTISLTGTFNVEGTNSLNGITTAAQNNIVRIGIARTISIAPVHTIRNAGSRGDFLHRFA